MIAVDIFIKYNYHRMKSDNYYSNRNKTKDNPLFIIDDSEEESTVSEVCECCKEKYNLKGTSDEKKSS